MDWLEFHNLDASRIPFDEPVYRNPEEHWIDTTYVLLDRKGHILHDGLEPYTTFVREQGEAGPLPFPPILFEEL